VTNCLSYGAVSGTDNPEADVCTELLVQMAIANEPQHILKVQA
jgi:hypothetical protein